MSKYFVIGNSASYGMLHGMYSTAIVEASTIEELEEWGKSLSNDVLTDYETLIFSWLYEDLEELYGENWCETDAAIDAIDEVTADEIEYSIYKIRDDITLTTEELDKISVELDWETFIDDYCEKGWDCYDEMLK